MLNRARDWWVFRQALREARLSSMSAPRGERDVLLIPCWRRPEFLWHCLHNLSQADGAAELRVIVRADTGHSPENLEVVREFEHVWPDLQVVFPVRCPFRRTKQSANVLLGYLEAAALSRRFVFLVEEDVIVARDFFLWHRAVHAAAGEIFCSIAVKNPNRVHQLPNLADEYYLNRGDYCSYGVCFDRRVLQRQIAPHVNLAYMRSPKKYLRRHFPFSHVGLGFVEQDGLLRRIQEQSDLPIAYPCLPRAYDAGFYGYNRPGGLGGEWRERVRALDAIIYDRERMRGVTSPEFAEQCVTVALQPPAWKRLRETALAI